MILGVETSVKKGMTEEAQWYEVRKQIWRRNCFDYRKSFELWDFGLDFILRFHLLIIGNAIFLISYED